MSKVTDELRGHEFDGIQEFDNPLPRWWLGLFIVTIIFGLIYAPWVLFGEGHLLADEYAADMAAAKEKYGDPSGEMAASLTPEMVAAACEGEDWKAPAEADFVANCASCHRLDGGGLVGPNFTDDYYIHGGRLIDLARTITLGVPAKGMITWGKTLKREQVLRLACKVRSLRGTTVENGKAAEGTQVGPDGSPLAAAGSAEEAVPGTDPTSTDGEAAPAVDEAAAPGTAEDAATAPAEAPGTVGDPATP